MKNNLTSEQWQAVAEKLAEYLAAGCMEYEYKENCAEICSLPCDPFSGFDFEEKATWIEQAKKELGYE